MNPTTQERKKFNSKYILGEIGNDGKKGEEGICEGIPSNFNILLVTTKRAKLNCFLLISVKKNISW